MYAHQKPSLFFKFSLQRAGNVLSNDLGFWIKNLFQNVLSFLNISGQVSQTESPAWQYI